MQHISIPEALEFGWHKMRQHSALMFQIFLTFFAVQVVRAIVERVLSDTLLGFLAGMALFGVSVWLGAGFLSIQLKLMHGHAARYHDLFVPRRIAWRYFLTSLAIALLSGIGIAVAMLAILPWQAVPALGVLVAIAGVLAACWVVITYMFAGFSAVEGSGPLEALRQSAKLTKGKKFDLIILILVCIGMNIVGAILFLIGLLITGPISALAVTHVYHKLKSKA